MKNYLTYKPEDLLLYLFGLIAYGTIIHYSLENPFIKAFLFIPLAFMFYSFILKNGFIIEFYSLKVILTGLLKYPIEILNDFTVALIPYTSLITCFVLSIALEKVLYSKIQTTFLIEKFPFETVFYLSLFIIEAYRFFILIEHIRKSKQVELILTNSPYKSKLKGMGIKAHIFQAYCTGVVTYFASILPCYIFWKLSSPTYFREIFLLIVFPLIQLFLVKLSSKRFDFITNQLKWFGNRHEHEHASRFLFTVFHGHHHDAIPSALIAGTNAGLFESIHRSTVRLSFLNSTILYMLVIRLDQAIRDILSHQYIPGVYPYCNYVVFLKTHHVVHHYLSLYPVSAGGFLDGPFIASDIEKGYDPSNPKAKWFADVVSKNESIDPILVGTFILRNKNADINPNYIHKYWKPIHYLKAIFCIPLKSL